VRKKIDEQKKKIREKIIWEKEARERRKELKDLRESQQRRPPLPLSNPTHHFTPKSGKIEKATMTMT
jgi:hypothetical protein